jgi:hypothetical protein
MAKWDGTERRADMVGLKVFMAETEIYRVSLCKKIEEMRCDIKSLTSSLGNLPCKERGEMYKGMSLTVKLVWAAIGITFGIVVAHLGWK